MKSKICGNCKWNWLDKEEEENYCLNNNSLNYNIEISPANHCKCWEAHNESFSSL